MFWTRRLGHLSELEVVGFGCLRWEVSVIKINEYEMNIHTYGLKRHVLDASFEAIGITDTCTFSWTITTRRRRPQLDKQASMTRRERVI